jgi:hypothetical protein
MDFIIDNDARKLLQSQSPFQIILQTVNNYKEQSNNGQTIPENLIVTGVHIVAITDLNRDKQKQNIVSAETITYVYFQQLSCSPGN